MPIRAKWRCGGLAENLRVFRYPQVREEGFVRRDPDPADRRSVLARITPAGLAWLEAFRAPTHRAMAAVFHGFTDTELDQLRHLCLRLVENQQRIAAEHPGHIFRPRVQPADRLRLGRHPTAGELPVEGETARQLGCRYRLMPCLVCVVAPQGALPKGDL